MAALIGKLIVLIPILAVLYPIMKSLPRLYDWVMRSKILRMYGELRLLEDEMTDPRTTGRDIREMIARLDRLPRQLRQKIESDPERPQYILTETGIGYRLRAPEQDLQ
jgi:hypothetical protein